MKRLFPILLLAALGGGCVWQQQPSQLPQAEIAPFAGNKPQEIEVCIAEPKENDIGRLEYPIDQKYWNMPHLGQIFTALDCGSKDRALSVAGFKGGVYTAGVSLSWGEKSPPMELQETLKSLGFDETKPGIWQTRNPLTLDQIDKLRGFFSSPDKSGGLEFEDCILCG